MARETANGFSPSRVGDRERERERHAGRETGKGGEKEGKRTLVRRVPLSCEREKDRESCRAPSCVGRVSAKRAYAVA